MRASSVVLALGMALAPLTSWAQTNGYSLDIAAAVNRVPGDQGVHMKEPGNVERDSEKGKDTERVLQTASQGAQIGAVGGAAASRSIRGVGFGGSGALIAMAVAFGMVSAGRPSAVRRALIASPPRSFTACETFIVGATLVFAMRLISAASSLQVAYRAPGSVAIAFCATATLLASTTTANGRPPLEATTVPGWPTSQATVSSDRTADAWATRWRSPSMEVWRERRSAGFIPNRRWSHWPTIVSKLALIL